MDPEANLSELEQIERLLSSIADEGTSQELIDQLESLLLDRPDLQEHYARMMRLHTLLTYEWSVSDKLLSPLVSKNHDPAVSSKLGSAVNKATSLGTDEHTNETVLAPKASQMNSEQGESFFYRGGGHFKLWPIFSTALAASLLLIVFGGFVERAWLSETASRTNFNAQDLRPIPLDERSEHFSNSEEGVVVRDPASLRLITRLTKTAVLNNFTLPILKGLEANSQITLCSGTVWMQPFPGRQERGYILAVPPQNMLEVIVDADSTGKNLLVIVEIDGAGHTAGDAVSFSNNSKDPINSNAGQHIGSIGNWSTFNHTSQNKYYLFTGSHLLSGQTTDKQWYLSDYRVSLNTNKIMCIGWDDSGYTVESTSKSQAYKADRDFNDVSATLHLHQPSDLDRDTQSGVHLIPEPIQMASSQGSGMIESDANGYQFSVAPGETAVVRVASDSGLPNSLDIANADTRQILWQDRGIQDGGDSQQSAGRGAYVIENNSTEIQNYLFVGRYCNIEKPKVDRWDISPQ